MRINCTTVAVLASILVLALILCLDHSIVRSSRSVRQIVEPSHTKERTDIFFLKTHKCASSTVQNILMRFGYRRHLDFVLPLSGNYIGHPKKFNRLKIAPKMRSPSRTYNIFTHHTRYDHTETKAVMKDGAAFVTILREPVALFESLYQFYNLGKTTNLTIVQLANVFLNQSSATNNFTAANLTRSADQRLGLNQMSFDLGFDDKTDVDEFIRNVDFEFDLVMMTEHMEASLILLRHLMNWPLENVVFLSLNTRQSARKANLSQIQKNVLLRLNSIDTRLYDYFLDKFKKRIRDFGEDRMKSEVENLLNANSQLWSRCVDKANNKGYAGTLGYDLRNIVDYNCFYSAKQELSFTDEIRNDQIRRFSVMAKLDKLMSKRGDKIEREIK
ncbi:Galactose-3-O-sulfotransferase [Nesidiocoris tenuis]|uniref:Galactose-3-O-sulfotransferase n=1 Tax=Nesidiocoris tenuis TaxID=355587 RepID=A0ABN7BBF5_9HEMI|nr:Galactose-3-O-sulfotransferase [Nesidiocoris tenuis]